MKAFYTASAKFYSIIFVKLLNFASAFYKSLLTTLISVFNYWNFCIKFWSTFTISSSIDVFEAFSDKISSNLRTTSQLLLNYDWNFLFYSWNCSIESKILFFKTLISSWVGSNFVWISKALNSPSFALVSIWSSKVLIYWMCFVNKSSCWSSCSVLSAIRTSNSFLSFTLYFSVAKPLILAESS